MSSTSSEGRAGLSRASAPLWALVDCNNFYASCERLFRPDLAGKPVVVLSNNDGCIVARSPEAKALGVPMGAPEYQWRAFLQQHGVAVFSSNYALYGDMSARIMRILEQHCPQVEQYSIDEAFVRLDGAQAVQAAEVVRQLRERVVRWTGISVSVGVARTRTLAKLANHIGKKRADGLAFLGSGAEDFALEGDDAHLLFRADDVLARMPVAEVWGIGRRQARTLWAAGITTAAALRDADDQWLRRALTVTGWRTALELRGLPCIAVENAPLPRHTLVSSRSFARPVTELAALREAVACFTGRAAERLRRAGLVAGGIAVHIRTSRHAEEGVPCHAADISLPLPEATADTLPLLRAARAGLERLFRPGLAYAKAGVMLYGLEAADRRQGSLLSAASPAEDRRREALMRTLDAINGKFGRESIFFGAQGLGEADWHMRQAHRSPRLTTRWDELPRVRC